MQPDRSATKNQDSNQARSICFNEPVSDRLDGYPCDVFSVYGRDCIWGVSSLCSATPSEPVTPKRRNARLGANGFDVETAAR
jgi:hypothetical protein